jgi:hypothetical protein
MKIGNRLPVLTAAALLVGMLVSPRAQSQSDAAAVPIGAKDIGGVVSSPQGREAGVWVIAETTELPTQFRRIVVTDDQGRYLVPDLPQADYSVWVRGYALVDSPKMRAKPGQRLDLAAASAPSAADAIVRPQPEKLAVRADGECHVGQQITALEIGQEYFRAT